MTGAATDDAHFDPWLRIHERVGGEILAAAPRSMVMAGTRRRLGEVDRDALP